jgi:hypothetical protein
MARPVFLAGVPNAAFLDPDNGDITPAWRAFLLSLWRRTGGAVGVSSDTTAIEQELAAETTARIAGDAALGSSVATERAARESGDAVLTKGLADETAARIAVDRAMTGRVSTNVSDIAAETQARIAADALLVPLAQLCSLWAACDLRFLPTTDPGSGRPWLNAGVLTVGALVGVTQYLGLEDASGRWTLEATGPADDWVWG